MENLSSPAPACNRSSMVRTSGNRRPSVLSVEANYCRLPSSFAKSPRAKWLAVNRKSQVGISLSEAVNKVAAGMREITVKVSGSKRSHGSGTACRPGLSEAA